MSSNSNVTLAPPSILQNLSELPFDIFSCFAPCLSVDDISSLYIAGDRRINQKLLSTVTRLYSESHYIHWNSITRFHLVELHIDALATFDTPFVPRMLPNTLKVIDFDFTYSLIMWIQPKTYSDKAVNTNVANSAAGTVNARLVHAEVISDMSSYFPHLEELCLKSSRSHYQLEYKLSKNDTQTFFFEWTESDWMIFYKGLPQTLRVLEVGSLDDLDFSFEHLSMLHTFSVEWSPPEEVLHTIKLPPSVTSLCIGGWYNLDVIHAPCTLQTLKHNHPSPGCKVIPFHRFQFLQSLTVMHPHQLPTCPVSLTYLNLNSIPLKSLTSILPSTLTTFVSNVPSPWNFQFLPSSILNIHLGAFSAFSWTSLKNIPPKLQTLIIEGRTNSSEMSAEEIDAIDAFPASLTSLQCPRAQFPIAPLLKLSHQFRTVTVARLIFEPKMLSQLLPPDLTCLSFPQDLQQIFSFNTRHILCKGTLEVPEELRDHDWLDLVPTELQTLSVTAPTICRASELFTKLPRSLSQLSFKTTIQFKNLASLRLPPKLTYAQLSHIKWSKSYYDSLPATLTYLEFIDTSCSKLSTELAMKLPRGLLSFVHPRCSSFVHKAIGALPRGLTLLNLSAAGSQSTDSCVALLPQSLTELTLMQAKQWSTKALPLLPPNMRVLQLHPDCPLLHTFNSRNISSTLDCQIDREIDTIRTAKTKWGSNRYTTNPIWNIWDLSDDGVDI